MAQNYQDAMCLVRQYGKPDLFITFTCNPYWPEIQENLFPNQTYCDRPDLVVRVFNLKFRQFLGRYNQKQLFRCGSSLGIRY